MRVNLQEINLNKVKCLIDTSTGPNLTSKFFLYPTWVPPAMRRDFLKHRNANKQPTSLEKASLLHLQMDDVRICMWFAVVEDLGVGHRQDTSVIYRYVEGILPQSVSLYHGTCDPLTYQHSNQSQITSYHFQSMTTPQSRWTRHVITS